MWVAYAYVAVIVACTNPGTADKACRGEAIEGFTDRSSCEVAVGKMAGLIEAMKAKDVGVRVDAECVAVVPPREA
jgi:hypothetical protein